MNITIASLQRLGYGRDDIRCLLHEQWEEDTPFSDMCRAVGRSPVEVLNQLAAELLAGSRQAAAEIVQTIHDKASHQVWEGLRGI